MRWALAIVAALLVAAVGAPAGAQTTPDADRRSEAESLFEQGKALLARDDWNAACALFEASARLAPAPPALVKLARCYAHAGHPARAIEVYERALAEKPWPELDRLVRAELFEIQRKTPSIRVTLVEPTEGVSLRRNGRPLSAEALRAPIWTDIGAPEHFYAEAAGHRAASIDVKASTEGEVLEVRIALVRDAPPPAPPPPPADARRPIGWALLGAGTLALGVGVGFGADFLARRGGLFDGCASTLADGRHVCPPATSTLRDDAVAARTRALALLGAGAGLSAIGVVLVATAPRRDREAPRVSLRAGPAAIDLRGTF